MLAELVDAVVGVDTHRDTHEVEIALPTGSPIASCTISNDAAGYVELLAWVGDHAPGPRPGPASSWRLKEPAATGLVWLGPSRPLDCR
jgi:hypothetical protein